MQWLSQRAWATANMPDRTWQDMAGGMESWPGGVEGEQAPHQALQLLQMLAAPPGEEGQ